MLIIPTHPFLRFKNKLIFGFVFFLAQLNLLAQVPVGGTATAGPSTICYGQTSTITLTGEFGTIQWQTDASGSFVDIPGETASTYTTPALITTTSYRAIVTDIILTDTSTVAIVSVDPESVGGTAMATASTICSGETTTINLSGETGTVQWQTDASGSFADIPGETGSSYTTPALTSATSYQAIVTSGVCTSATSSSALVSVDPVSAGGTATPTASTICSGGTTSISLTSYTGSIQWQTDASGSFVDIPGETGSSYTTPALTSATSYQAIVTSGVCASATSSSALVSVDPVSAGGTATATASTICSGGTTSISLTSYTGSIQWQTDASGSFVDVPGETGSSYTTPALTSATSYQAIVTSGVCASATSSSALVSVDPVSAGGTATATASTICSGGTTSISLTSYTGSIQWQTNASGSFVNISGATSASYTTPALTTPTSYRAIVTSGVCNFAISSSALVSIDPASAGGTATATTSTICSGGTTSITLTSYTGSIQWQTNASGSFVNISGATSASYTTPALTTPTSYRAIVTSGTCAPAISSSALVSIDPVSAGGTATATASPICSGGTTSITLTSYTGSIQWQSNASGSFVNISGATNASYTTPALTAPTSYRAIVTSGVCASATSSSALVSVDPASAGGTATATASTICSGGTTSITLTSYTGSIQWQTDASGSFVNISGATSASYTTPALTTPTSYRAIVTSGTCAPAISSSVLVSIDPVSAGGTATATASPICSGGTTSITLTSYTGSIQWQTNASGSFVNISGATSASYTTPALTAPTSYRAIVTSGVCNFATSSSALVSIDPASAGGTATATASIICSGGTTSITLTSYSGSIQWQTNASGSFVNISGATGSSYTTPALTAPTSYRATVTSGVCASATSSSALVSIDPVSAGGTATATASAICSGGTTSITLTSYTGSIQWQTNASGSFVNISGATNASYTTPALTAPTSYRAIVTSGVCASATSSSALVSIDPVSAGGTAAATSSTICSGGSTTIILASHVGNIQWQSNASGSFADISGATSASYVTPVLNSTTGYRANVTSGACPSSLSTVATVSVSPTSAGGTATPASSSICSGGTTSINLTSYTGSIQWQTNASGSFVNISGATGSSYTTPALTTATSYKAIVTSGVCTSATSTTATVSIVPVLVGGTAVASPSTVCSGGITTLTLTGNTGSIQWQSNASGSFADIPGATGSSYNTPALTASTSYRAILSSGACATATSTTATVSIAPPSSAGSASPSPGTICNSGSSTITLSSYSGSIQWQSNESGSFADIAGATSASYVTPVLTSTTSYRGIVTNGTCAPATSGTAVVSVSPASAGGTAAATSSSICSGSSTTIVLASYTGSIQWQTNASGSFVNISGATSASYTTPNLTTSTSYRAVVTSGICASSTSTTAIVSIAPPSAGGTASAAASSVCTGGSTTINLSSYTGTIQWQSNASGSFTDIPGATGVSYPTPSLTTATSYRAIVTSGTCSPATSSTAVVSVSPASVGGIAAATSPNICSGSSTTIVLASSTGSIQWQSNASGSFADIAGATSASYTTPNLSTSTGYRAIVTSGVCAPATSTTASVSIAPTSAGGTASAVASSVCTGGSTTINLSSYTGTIQWQSNASGSFVNISGATGSSYTTPALTASTSYRAIVTSGTCASATSSSALVFIDPVSAGGTATATASAICSGGTTTITLTSYTGSIQWQSNASGSFADISGATSASYLTPVLTSTTSYRANLTSGACPSATSSVATVSVSPTSVGGTATTTASTICSGGSTTINLTSYTGSIQWQSNASGSFVNISGATGASYITPNLTVATSYRAIVKSGVCASATSTTATVSISPASAGGTATAVASSLCSGASTTINVSSYTGTIQWQSNESGSFVDISGATSTSYVTPVLTSTTGYRAVVSSGVCPSALSTVATVSVSPTSAGGTATAASSNICSGGTTSINLTSYTGSIQWQTNASGSFVNIAGATNASYTTPNLTVATSYRAIVKSGICASATSTTATVSIVPVLVGGTASPVPATVCYGNTSTITLIGYSGSTIQWQNNATGSFVNISGATNASYITPNLTVATSYRAIVSSGACAPATSSIASVSITPSSSAGSASPSPGTICNSGSSTITLSSYSGSIQWQSNESGSFADIAGATSASYVTPVLTSTTSYRGIVTNGTCAPATSGTAVVSVSPASAGGTAAATSSSICSGSSTTIVLASYTGSIQWQTNASGSFVNISGATSASYTTPNLTTSTSYRAVVTSGICASSTSTTAIVSIAPPSAGGTASAAASSVCTGGSTTINLSSYTGTIQWQSNASGSFTDIPGATGVSYPTPSLTTATSYRAIVTSGTCSPATSSTAVVSVSPASVGGIAAATSPNICSGSSTTIVLASSTGSIQWQSNASGSFADIAGATSASYTTPNLSTSTGYRAIVTSGVCAPATSTTASVSIAPTSAGGTASAVASSVCTGGSTTINLSSYTGTIQWQSNASGSFVNIPGATGVSYVTPSLTTATSYRAIVTSGTCSPATSSLASVSISPLSAGGTGSAISSSICSGGTTTINLSGHTGTIQWQSNASGSFVDIAGATSASYLTPVLTSTTGYRANVTSGACPSAASSVATVTVSPTSAGGTATAASSSICSGGSTTINLTSYTGSIQWQSNALGSFVNISGATGASYITPNLTVATSYRAIVKSGVCPSATSTTATVTIVPVLVGGTASPVPATVCYGSSSTITLTGYIGSTIQWQNNASGSFADIAGATGSSYTTLALSTSTSYQAVVSSGSCPSAISSIATVSLSPTSAGGTATAASSTICSGGNTSINLISYTGSIQWQTNASGSFVNISGAVNPSYTTPVLTSTTAYRAIVGNGVCASDSSNTVWVQVDSVSVGGIATATSYTICSGGVSTLNLSSYKGSIQWQTNASGSFVNIPGASNPSFTTPALTSTSSYRAIVTSGVCPSATSTTITLVVNQTIAPSGSAAQNFCSINTPTLAQLTVTGSAIKWYSSVTGGSPLVSTSPLVNGTSYFASQSLNGCESSSRFEVLVTLKASPSIISDPLPVSACSGSAITFSVTATGAGLAYQWMMNTGSGYIQLVDNSTYSGSTTSSLTVSAILPGMNANLFKCIVNGTCPLADTSLAAALTVLPLPQFTQQPVSLTVCNGSDASFGVVASGSGVNYKWQVNAGSSFVDIVNNSMYSNSATPTLKITAASASLSGSKFRCLISIPGCGSAVISDTAVITVNNPVLASAGANQILTCGATSTALKANNPFPGTGTWSLLSPGPVVTNSNQYNSTITGLPSGITLVKWKTSIAGCKADSSTVSLLVDCKSGVFIPTGFSPDGDGINDYLVIEGIEKYPGAILKIYNRWGDLVYEKENYENNWDGTSNMSGVLFDGKLPTGTYFMYVDYANGTLSKISYLIIKY